MREESFHENPEAAVIDGYADGAKVVGSAAIIMILVFASFIFSPDPTTKSFGFALALGVLIDACVIRMTVVPATMHIYGRSAWWLPRWLTISSQPARPRLAERRPVSRPVVPRARVGHPNGHR